MFELGLFMGALGREPTVFVYNRDSAPSLPSDRAGVTCLTYPNRGDGNLRAALGPVATTLADVIKRLGIRESQRIERREEQVEHRVRLLVRSRRVEIDLIARQFGPFTQAGFLEQARTDLADLEASLSAKKQDG